MNPRPEWTQLGWTLYKVEWALEIIRDLTDKHIRMGVFAVPVEEPGAIQCEETRDGASVARFQGGLIDASSH